MDDASGEPLSDVAVSVRPLNARGGLETLQLTDSTGGYTAVAGPGRYTLIARKPGYGHATTEVNVSESADAVADLRLRRTDGVLVRAVDARSGAPVHAHVFVYDEHERLIVMERNPEFSQSIRVALATGNYLMIVRAANDAYVDKRVRVSSPSDIEVRLEPAAVLILVARGQGAYRVSILTEAESGAGQKREIRMTAGTRRLGRLAAGTYLIRLMNESGETLLTRSVVLTAGAETTIDLP